MFDPSEKIFMSKVKDDDGSSDDDNSAKRSLTRSKGSILSRSQRERASTWSSPSPFKSKRVFSGLQREPSNASAVSSISVSNSKRSFEESSTRSHTRSRSLTPQNINNLLTPTRMIVNAGNSLTKSMDLNINTGSSSYDDDHNEQEENFNVNFTGREKEEGVGGTNGVVVEILDPSLFLNQAAGYPHNLSPNVSPANSFTDLDEEHLIVSPPDIHGVPHENVKLWLKGKQKSDATDERKGSSGINYLAIPTTLSNDNDNVNNSDDGDDDPKTDDPILTPKASGGQLHLLSRSSTQNTNQSNGSKNSNTKHSTPLMYADSEESPLDLKSSPHIHNLSFNSAPPTLSDLTMTDTDKNLSSIEENEVVSARDMNVNSRLLDPKFVQHSEPIMKPTNWAEQEPGLKNFNFVGQIENIYHSGVKHQNHINNNNTNNGGDSKLFQTYIENSCKNSTSVRFHDNVGRSNNNNNNEEGGMITDDNRNVSSMPTLPECFDSANGVSYNQPIARQSREKSFVGEFIHKKICCFCPRINRPGWASWSRVSHQIVKYAPCFCCARRLETSATDRMLLIRLNILCAFFSLAQFTVGVFILIVFLSERVADRQVGNVDGYWREALTPNLWMMNGCLLILALVGLVLFLTMILTIPIIRRVNLPGAIRYMWILYWMVPLEILFVIALFDYHKVTNVWIKHWWSSPSMAWFRTTFCEEGTANGKCAVPLYGGENYSSTEEWCVDNYNAIDCGIIRTKATDKMSYASYFFIYSNAIGGAVLIILLLIALGLLEGIISAPIVQRSKESNISLWLTLPIVGCFSGGAALLFAPQSLISSDGADSVHWIGYCYLITGVSFTLSALLGWFISWKTVFSIRDKMHKKVAVYGFIVMMVLTIFAVASIFTASLIFSLNIAPVDFDDENRGIIACFIDAANSCTCCDDDNGDDVVVTNCDKKCPEWTTQDVARIIQTQLKQSATLAAIFVLYAFSALRFGFSLRTAVSKYEIDYV